MKYAIFVNACKCLKKGLKNISNNSKQYLP